MSNEAPAKGSEPDQLQLALERTYLAHERTLMAWIRTATSLITFGLALYKFFFYLHEQDPARHPERIFGARTFGLLMIVIGLMTLALATWQRRQDMRRLRSQFPGTPRSLALVTAALIAGLGVAALLAALFQG